MHSWGGPEIYYVPVPPIYLAAVTARGSIHVCRLSGLVYMTMCLISLCFLPDPHDQALITPVDLEDSTFVAKQLVHAMPALKDKAAAQGVSTGPRAREVGVLEG